MDKFVRKVGLLHSEYTLGMVAAGPFVPNALVFGAIVGVASREAGQSAVELLIAAFAVNAATSQLAALDYWRGALSYGSVLVATALLNAKHVLHGASLGQFFRETSKMQLAAIGFTLTDSSWLCCQLAAQRGSLTSKFAIANSWTLLAVWVVGCLLGYFLGAIASPVRLQMLGLSGIALLSMASLAPKALRASKELVWPGAVASITALGLHKMGTDSGAAILMGTVVGASLAAVVTYET